MINRNLQDIRKALKSMNADAVLISMKCSFDNYDSDFSDIRAISGFSGSNGRAVVSQSKAILAVDGRYTTQAVQQTDNTVWEIEQYPESTVLSMVQKILLPGETIAVSSLAHSYKSFMGLKRQIETAGFKVQTIEKHPVLSYRNKTPQNNRILITETENISNRIKTVTAKLQDNEVLLIANKETVSWIFGTRKEKLGADKNPVANAMVLLTKHSKPIMFSDLDIEDNNFFEHYYFDQFQNIADKFKNMLIKASYAYVPAYFILSLIQNGFDIAPTENNYTTFEHLKNPEEIDAQKKGAKETSIAFIRALAYIDYYIKKGEKITEQDAVSYFETNNAIDFAFNPICASEENTAIVHYTPGTGNNSFIKKDALFLFDAGFHFKNSTTDMTRTVYIGDNPPNEFRTIYTVILKSFIHYSLCKFPDNTYACALDAVCRYYMWQNDMDFEFGTGHGVGNYRSAHEAPHIGRYSSDKITADMITTVEPGYYTKQYGIRLENMLLSVRDLKTNMIQFETITYIPFCHCLINKQMLNNETTTWLNKYHSDIARMFLPIFKNDHIVTSWLVQNTKIL